MKTEILHPDKVTFLYTTEALELLATEAKLTESDLCHVTNVQNLRLDNREVMDIVNKYNMNKDNVIGVLADPETGPIAEAFNKADVTMVAASRIKSMYNTSWDCAVA